MTWLDARREIRAKSSARGLTSGPETARVDRFFASVDQRDSDVIRGQWKRLQQADSAQQIWNGFNLEDSLPS